VADRDRPFRSALAGAVVAGEHYGRHSARPGVVVSEIREPGLAMLAARKGRRGDLIAAVRSGFGVDLPATPRRVVGQRTAFVWLGPDQWLALQHPAPKDGMEALLAPLAGLASLFDQSHGRTLLALTGSRVLDALAKGVPIDLHPRTFKPGDAASTLVAHIPIYLWQVDDRPSYEFAIARSLAQSFWHWLVAAAGEYGLQVADG
jgi:heterotetrameric sarcosine oxidase gamma subunit